MYFFTTTALLASSLGAATASYGYEQELYARDLDSSGLHAHAPRDAEPAYGSYRRDVDDMDDYHHMLDARNAELEDEDLYRREAQFDNEDLYRRDADFDDEDLYRREAEFGDEDLYRRDADIDNEDLYRREAALYEDDLFRRDAELDDDDLYRREAAYDDLYRREAAYDDLYRREADYDEPHFGDASDLFARAAGTEQCKMGCTSRYNKRKSKINRIAKKIALQRKTGHGAAGASQSSKSSLSQSPESKSSGKDSSSASKDSSKFSRRSAAPPVDYAGSMGMTGADGKMMAMNKLPAKMGVKNFNKKKLMAKNERKYKQCKAQCAGGSAVSMASMQGSQSKMGQEGGKSGASSSSKESGSGGSSSKHSSQAE